MSRFLLLVSGLMTLMMLAVNPANAATAYIVNATNCSCKTGFPDPTGCSLSGKGTPLVQAADGKFNAYGSPIAVGSMGPAPLFKEQQLGYTIDAIQALVGKMNMPMSFGIAKPGVKYYVVSMPIMDTFVSYFFNPQNPCG